MKVRYIDVDPYRASAEFRYLSIRQYIVYRPGWIHIYKGGLLDLGAEVILLPFKYKHYNVRVSKGVPGP